MKFGPTNKFPQGKLNNDDEGEIQFGIANDGTHVILNFGKPVSWLGMGPSDARAIASVLIKHAEIVEKKAN